MKKITQWFNDLTVQQQRYALLSFCLLFATLLIASMAWQRTNMNIGTMKPRYPMNTLKTK